MTSISPDLLAAYMATDFKVLEPWPFVLRVGHISQALVDLYGQIDVECAGFLTAWNPYSNETSFEENELAQQSLIQRLSYEGYPFLKALGVDPSGDWPGEDSVFVPGLDFERAKLLGTEFGQNAIVWVGADAVPELILLR